jgi:hypothetical protein
MKVIDPHLPALRIKIFMLTDRVQHLPPVIAILAVAAECLEDLRFALLPVAA